MPRGNGMGPNGQGPMTGRGAGYCGGADAPGFATGGAGRQMGGGRGNGFGGNGLGGGGRRRGGGMGRRHRFFADVAAWWKGQDASDTELAVLKRRAEELSEASAGIQARIAALEAASEKTE